MKHTFVMALQHFLVMDLARSLPRCSILRTLCQQRTLPTRPGDQGFSQAPCSAPDVPPEIRKEPEASLEFFGNDESNL